MTKSILSLLVLVFVTSIISCRKSENDPLLSLKTRNSRITGYWKLAEMELDYTFSYTYDTTTYEQNQHGSYDINDGIYTIETDDSTYTWEYSYDMEITKEGTLIIHRKTDDLTQEFKDYWWWSDGTKKKTGITMWGGIYRIDRLSNKELILVGDYYNKSIDPENEYKSDGTYNYKLTFEKDKNQ